MKTGAVIVAAGTGKRMGSDIAKQFLLLEGKEILAHTVARFDESALIDEIVLVVAAEQVAFVREMAQEYGWKKVKDIVAGGKERQNSVENGLLAFDAQTEIVLVHDGVRPFVTEEMLSRVIAKAKENGASVLGVQAKDTIKKCDELGFVLETPERKNLWQIQTPQVFSKKLLLEAYRYAQAHGFLGTDDSSVVEFFGHKVMVVEGDYRNIKITTKEDLLLAKCFLKEGLE